MNSVEQKLCEITDIIPIRIFPDRAKKMGPIKPMLMSDNLIFSILNGRPAPKHFYAIDPNNRSRKILLTKENHTKTTEELFGNNVNTVIQVQNNYKSEPEDDVAIDPIDDVDSVNTENETEKVINYSVETPSSLSPESVDNAIDDEITSENDPESQDNTSDDNTTDDTDTNKPYRYTGKRKRR